MKKLLTILLLFIFQNNIAQTKVGQDYYIENFNLGFSKWSFKQANKYKWMITNEGPKKKSPSGFIYPVGAIDPPLKDTSERWMIIDAFQAGTVNLPIDAKLFSPRYDCSNFKEIYLKFNTLFRRNSSSEQLFVGISSDSLNFEYQEIFTDVNKGHFCDGKVTYLKTQNPYEFTIKFGDKYTEKSKIWFSFYYKYPFNDGDNYSWQIDDVEIFGQDPTPLCDLQIKDDYYAISPFRVYPISQLDSIPFLVDVINNSKIARKNIKINVEITDLSTKNKIFQISETIDEIAAKSTFENFSLSKKFLPPPNLTSYKVVYSLSSNGCNDEKLSNNQYSFSFETSKNIFQKEKGKGTRRVSPDFFNGETNWAFGNHFYIKKGDKMKATSIAFSIDNPTDLFNDSISTLLYKWENSNNNDKAEGFELTLVGAKSILADFTSTTKELIFNLLPTDLTEKDVLLEDETDYLAVVKYHNNFTDQKTMLMLVNDTTFYDAAFFASVKHRIYNSVLSIGDETDYSTSGFDSPMTPLVRLRIDEVKTSISDTENQNAISIFPNPSSGEFFIKNADNNLVIEKINVKNIVNQSIINNINSNSINLQSYPNGIYLVEIYSNQGIFTQKIWKK